MRQSLYVRILAKMDARLKNAFGENAKVRLVPKTLVELAKQMGYIEGIKGPGGGYSATDKGLQFLDMDVEEFLEKENKQKVEKLHEQRTKAREASLQRANELSDLISAAQKEFGGEVSSKKQARAQQRE